MVTGGGPAYGFNVVSVDDVTFELLDLALLRRRERDTFNMMARPAVGAWIAEDCHDGAREPWPRPLYPPECLCRAAGHGVSALHCPSMATLHGGLRAQGLRHR
jgi:hypothetical protein